MENRTFWLVLWSVFGKTMGALFPSEEPARGACRDIAGFEGISPTTTTGPIAGIDISRVPEVAAALIEAERKLWRAFVVALAERVNLRSAIARDGFLDVTPAQFDISTRSFQEAAAALQKAGVDLPEWIVAVGDVSPGSPAGGPR